MQVMMSSAIMQVLRLFGDYKDNNFCCSYVGGSLCCSRGCDCFCCNYHPVRSFCSTYASDRKTFKGILSGLHFTTFVNILPKLRYFEGINYIQLN